MLYFTGYTLSIWVLPSKRYSVGKARLYLTVSLVPLLAWYLRAKITREEEKSWNPHTIAVTSERVNVKNHVYMRISRVNAKDHVDMWISRVNVKDHVDVWLSSHFFFPLKSFLSH